MKFPIVMSNYSSCGLLTQGTKTPLGGSGQVWDGKQGMNRPLGQGSQDTKTQHISLASDNTRAPKISGEAKGPESGWQAHQQ